LSVWVRMLDCVPQKRTYTDQQLTEAVANSTCWADVKEALGMRRQGHSTWLQRNAARLDLDMGHFTDYRRSAVPLSRADLPFKECPNHRVRGRVGASIAMQWFLSHGYMVSIPVEATTYEVTQAKIPPSNPFSA
jgi:hypothetical protein